MSVAEPIPETRILMAIQNRKRPEQKIHLVQDESTNSFVTHGLKDLFGVEEIRLATSDLIEALQEYAQVLAFILETISTAEDIHLTYRYQEEFEFGGQTYTLHKRGEYRVLQAVRRQEKSLAID